MQPSGTCIEFDEPRFKCCHSSVGRSTSVVCSLCQDNTLRAFAMAADDRRKIVASNLPSDMSTAEYVTIFFESKRYCPAGGEVTHVEMNAEDRSAVVTFDDRSGRPSYCVSTAVTLYSKIT